MRVPNFQHPICKECIKEHCKKYRNYAETNGKELEEWTIDCRGIPLSYVPQKYQQILSKEEIEQLEDTLNPIRWAKKNLKCIDTNGGPWEARWYQERMLLCTARRKVSRLGRQLGKCLVEGTQVMTPTGAKNIEQIRPGDLVYSYDIATDSIKPVAVVNIYDRGIQDVVDLVRWNNVVESATLEHRWLVNNKRSPKSVKTIKNFNTDDLIVRKFVDIPGGLIKNETAYALGAMLGDGCCREKGHKLVISSEDGNIPHKVAKLIGCVARKNKGENYTWTIEKEGQQGVHISFPYYDEWCKQRYAHEKIADLDVVQSWDRQSQLEFLAGLLDTDGSVQYKHGQLNIAWSMQAKSVIECIQGLMLSLFQYKIKIFQEARNKDKNGPCWVLSITNNLFVKRIIKNLSPYLVIERKKWKQEYENALENNENADACGFRIDKTKTRSAHCYDLEIDTPDHLYLLANGLVTHNSAAIAVDILHFTFTNKNKRVLVVTPMKSHAEQLFKKLKEFIDLTPEIATSVIRMRNSPYIEIAFGNGSTILGFSAGTTSGSEARSVRGITADRVYIDEADYLSEADLDAIVATMLTRPDSLFWASSTPTGRRSHFYGWCLQTPSYKEFHYQCYVNPIWNKIEAQVKADYAGKEEGWIHEMLAEFGEQSVGVFQNAFVDRAIENYNYETQKIEPGTIYGIGIDWNSNYGTEIFVVGYDGKGRFRAVDAINIPKQEWTQLGAMEAVIAMNAKWHPSFVYADEGHGATNIELLRKYGQEIAARNPQDPAARLMTIVKAYNFSTKIEIHDPLTKQPIKKASKPFLVENAARFFEENRIVLSGADHTLINQLGNYIVKYYTVGGIAVYGQIDEKIGDHRLDAFMLALVGFKLEFSEFGQPVYTTKIAITQQTFYTGDKGIGQVNQKRVSNFPQSRYNEHRNILSSSSIPGNTTHGQIPEQKWGWDTDEEEKYRQKFALRRARKQGRRRGILPSRSNF